jgi:hypothetical protein
MKEMWRNLLFVLITAALSLETSGHNKSLTSLEMNNTSTEVSNRKGHRRLDIMWEYHKKQRHRPVPKYKEKTTHSAISEWNRNIYYNPTSSRHKRRRSAAYVALTAREFDPTVRTFNSFTHTLLFICAKIVANFVCNNLKLRYVVVVVFNVYMSPYVVDAARPLGDGIDPIC